MNKTSNTIARNVREKAQQCIKFTNGNRGHIYQSEQHPKSVGQIKQRNI